MSTKFNALVITPPYSPRTDNPPLGPAILRWAGRQGGVEIDTLDLGLLWNAEFGTRSAKQNCSTIGDHGKDPAIVRSSRQRFLACHPLSGKKAPTEFMADAVDPILGMQFPFEMVDGAVILALEPGHPFHAFLTSHLSSRAPSQVVGVSLMGPEQVFFGLVIAKWVRQHWPKTNVVAGGSHITSLAQELRANPEYRRYFDQYFTGHCEQEFTNYVSGKLNVIGTAEVFSVKADFADALGDYDRERLTIPLQLSRGCPANCAFCTYPVVERLQGRCQESWQEIVDYMRSWVDWGASRFSVKDSWFEKRHMLKLAAALLEAGLGSKIAWSATTRPVSLTHKDLQRLFNAGCHTLEFGVETVHPRGRALLEKRDPMAGVEEIIQNATLCGIEVVINLIYGLPGETVEEAWQQRNWFHALQRACPPGKLNASESFLEINRGSPIAQAPDKYGIVLNGIAPWAFSYAWNAPVWRAQFKQEIEAGEGEKLRSCVKSVGAAVCAIE